jgi:16S rRNA (guanine527-N7)-methyltransferase
MVWAICRTDLMMTLVEPLLRRVTFLNEAAQLLGIGNVEVVRARAEELHGKREFDVVTSRAVAPLDRLSGWCLPLVRQHGVMVALKGASVRDELDAAAPVIKRLGGGEPEVVERGTDILGSATCTVVVRKVRQSYPKGAPGRSRRRGGH